MIYCHICTLLNSLVKIYIANNNPSHEITHLKKKNLHSHPYTWAQLNNTLRFKAVSIQNLKTEPRGDTKV